MDYQAICAAIEVPVYNAFTSLNPPINLYFDNITAVPPDPPGEYIRVNVSMGATTESTLQQSLDFVRGIIVFRFYTRKDTGPLRSRQLASVAKSVLDELSRSQKPDSGVFLRVQDVRGPTFPQNEELPHYFARMEASWHATQIC